MVLEPWRGSFKCLLMPSSDQSLVINTLMGQMYLYLQLYVTKKNLFDSGWGQHLSGYKNKHQEAGRLTMFLFSSSKAVSKLHAHDLPAIVL